MNLRNVTQMGTGTKTLKSESYRAEKWGFYRFTIGL